MNIQSQTYFSWSSGKDAALALYHLQAHEGLKVNRLLTTVNQHLGRVSMHGLRKELLEKQADATGIPLSIIEVPKEPTMEQYDALMEQTLAALQEEGFTQCGFGDIFLEDLKVYTHISVNKNLTLWLS